MIHKETLILFLRKEGKVLNGQHSINTLMIFLIFLISLLSISFAKAGLSFLEMKMEDPFIKWVDIKALQGRNGTNQLERFLFSDSIQSTYSFSNPKPNYTYSPYFCQVGSNKEPQFQGRSFDATSPLFAKIIESGKNGIVKIDTITNESNGVIITLDALKELGYIESTRHYDIEQLPRYINMAISFNPKKCNELLLGNGNDGYYPVAIPVLAVVKDVPGVEYTFMFSDEYMNIMSDLMARDITSPINNQYLHLYGKDTNIAAGIEYIKSNVSIPITINVNESEGWNAGYQDVYIELDTCLNDTARTLILNRIANDVLYIDNTITRVYDLQSSRRYNGLIPLYSIEINDLKQIRTLQSALKNECQIRLDMRNIEAQENFQKMETVGTVLSFSIIVLALLFVTVFIFFLLSTHFQGIQMNLGTFKAFGIENKMLYLIYLILMSSMTLASFVTAWLLVAIGEGILVLFGWGFEPGYPFVDAFSIPVLWLFIFAMIVSIGATLYIAFTKLNHTPGDLIYNRHSN